VSAPAGAVFTAADEGPAQGLQKALAVVPDALEAYHGYLLGHLIYPSYVTTGLFNGTTLASSPEFGLVAGVRPVGAGRVLFVNLPLGYLKGRTDALPMHGFLNYFVQHVLQGTRLSAMPNGVAGLTFDWHLDSMAAQAPSLALEAAGVFTKGPFSMEMTAGPDAVVPGDGLGWNLNFNPVAQQLLRRLDGMGHAVGSHGGWVHDYFGNNMSETNAAEFMPLLQWNQAAVDGVLGKPARSYSAPQGNNPPWAMDWLEQQGVVGAYFGGHTGLGATRQYRDGVLKNPALYVFPVTPQGLYATFEEFQIYQVPKADAIDWYRSLVDFSIEQNTSRLVYAHPPGANTWRDVLDNLLAYAAGKGVKFQWYAMPRLANFMAQRQQVAWAETILATGATRFDASHPTGLGEMVWMLPKNRYAKPVIVTAGGAVVVNGGTVWLVKAAAVKQLRFRALPNPLYVAA
jgi:peptidoglycan/xylan/chitin deacetylase (PgdA/CDA1 family)